MIGDSGQTARDRRRLHSFGR